MKEITPDTDPEAYETCLQQAAEKMAAGAGSADAAKKSDIAGRPANAGADTVGGSENPGSADAAGGSGAPTIDTAASRFFDIEIVVADEEGDLVKIEPMAAVAVSIRLSNATKEAGISGAADPADAADAADRAGTAGAADAADTPYVPADNGIDASGAVSVVESDAGSGSPDSDQNSDGNSDRNSDPTVLHFAEDGVEEINSMIDSVIVEPASDTGDSARTENATAINFEAESFSIYGVVYTVDYHWKVNGSVYDFSIPGGGFVSFEHLVEALGIGTGDSSSHSDAGNGTETRENDPDDGSENAGEAQETSGTYDEAIRLNERGVSEAARRFVAEVASLEFSDPELIWAGKTDEAATVGGLKEANGLETEYSAELTEDQIAEINAQTVEAGDWALISVHPFTSEETLTVTMKNGEQFVVRVTDAQIKKTVIDAKGDTWEITVTYGEDAQIPDGAELKAREILPETEEYYEYYRRAADLVCTYDGEGNRHGYGRLFDISIWKENEEIEPQSRVQVGIKLADAPEDSNELSVVHFGENEPEVLQVEEMSDKASDSVGDQTEEDNNAELRFEKGASFTISKYTDDSFRSKDTTWGNGGSKTLSDVENPDGTYTLNGIFEFEQLATGYYMIEETEFPAGYVKLSGNPTFKVEVNTSSGFTTTLINNPDNLLHLEDDKLTIVVGNTPGAALPDTGGPGTGLFYLLGFMITGLAAAGLAADLVMRKLRRRH